MPDSDNHKLAIYRELCNSYRAIDDFRAKLLGLLPLATGGGIYLLVNDKVLAGGIEPYLRPVGLFGFIVTLGLFIYEIYGIRKCGALIEGGKQIECSLHVNGQFAHRPREVFGLINEPFAAGVIYPAVLSAWIFLAKDFDVNKDWSSFNPLSDAKWAVCVFTIGFVGMLVYNFWLKHTEYFIKKKMEEGPMLNIIEPVKTYIGRLPLGADLLTEIENFCKKENITLGKIEGIGAVQKACIQYFNQKLRKYSDEPIIYDQRLEITNLAGNVSLKNNEPYVHAHITMADEKGNTFGGHLEKGTEVFAFEIIVQSFTGTKLVRSKDETTRLWLWNDIN